jgi:hypothetical protein
MAEDRAGDMDEEEVLEEALAMVILHILPMPQPLPPIPAMDPVILIKEQWIPNRKWIYSSQRQRTLRLNWKQSIKELMN